MILTSYDSIVIYTRYVSIALLLAWFFSLNDELNSFEKKLTHDFFKISFLNVTYKKELCSNVLKQ